MKMRKDTADKLYRLVLSTRINLDAFGRPRKHPGKPRPNQVGAKFSLPGQLSYRAGQLNISLSLRRQAEDLIVKDLIDNGIIWHDIRNLKIADDYVSDTREIVRSLRRVEEQLKKVLVS